MQLFSHKAGALASLSLLVFAFASCKSTDLSKPVNAYRAGDLAIAAKEIGTVKTAKDTDCVWVEMERASILKALGQIPESQAALERCQLKMDELLASTGQEAVAVGGLAGAGAVMTDDRQCNYVGALYESQLVCAMQAMNALLLSSPSAAQAAISQLRNRVDEASTMKEKIANYLEKKREENAKEREDNAAKYGDSFTKFNDAMTLTDADGALKSAYTSWADTSVGIGLYLGEIVNRETGRKGEFTTYMSRASADALRQSWRQVDYTALGEGLSKAAAQLESVPVGSATYIIVEAGLAPQRVLNTERMNAMKGYGLDVQLPGLSEASYSGKVTIDAEGQAHEAVLVMDVGLVKRNEFDVNYPDMEYRAVLGKVIKELIKTAGAAVALTSDSRDAQIIGALAFVGGAIASAAQGADLRSWDCLPHRYLAVAIPTPADGVLKVQTDGASETVRVVPGTSNIVVVTSVQPAHCSVVTAPITAVAAN